MDSITPSWLFVFVGLGLIFLELLVGVHTGFDLVLIGVSLIAGGVVGNWRGSWETGLVVTIVLTVAYLLLARQFVKNKLAITTKKSNIDSLVGDHGVVTKKITPNHPGQVRLSGEIWRATGDRPLGEGTLVHVVSVEGVTVHVVESV